MTNYYDAHDAKRHDSQLDLRGGFGSRWEFKNHVHDSISINAFTKSNRSHLPDVQVGLGAKQTLALRDFLVELFGVPEGYVKAVQKPAFQAQAPKINREPKYQVGQRVILNASAPRRHDAWRGADMGWDGKAVYVTRVAPSYRVEWGEGAHWMAVYENEIERAYTLQDELDTYPVGTSVNFNHETGFTWTKREDGTWATDYGTPLTRTGSILTAPQYKDRERARWWVRETREPEKPKTVLDALNEHPVGTIIKFDRDGSARYIRNKKGWVSLAGGWELKQLLTDPADRWTFQVKYNPEED